MATLIKHKRVEFSELFYDLVFVFAISKATALIHPKESLFITVFWLGTLYLISSSLSWLSSIPG